MLSKSADPSLATPSQVPTGEGVETGREPPDRVTAKAKAQSRPRTLVERRRKPKWYGIRRVLVRAQEGQSEARFEPMSNRAFPLRNVLKIGDRLARRCAYCDGPGPLTRDHVWP